MYRYLGLAALAIAQCSCTTALTSNELTSSAGSEPGIPYTLPATQYRIAAKYILVDCDALQTGKGSPFKLEIVATPSMVDGKQYVIDPRSLASRTKTASLELTYHDNSYRLKSINAEVDDRSPEIAGNFLKAGFGVARLALGLGVAGGGDPADQTAPRCKEPVAKAVRELGPAIQALEAIPKKADELQTELALYTLRAQLGPLNPDDRRRSENLIAEIEALSKSKAALTNSIAALGEALTLTVPYTFPSNAESGPFQDILTPPEEVSKQWLNRLIDFGDATDGWDRMLSLRADLSPVAMSASSASAVEDEGSHATFGPSGVYYRKPEAAYLTIGLANPPVSSEPEASSAPLLRMKVEVPQFGQMYVLALVNRWGENNAIGATFAEDGRLQTYKFDSKSSAAEAAAGITNETVTDAIALTEALRTKRDADQAAELAEAKAQREETIAERQFQIDLLTKSGQLAKLEEGEDSNATERSRLLAELQAEVSILKLQQERDALLAAVAGQ